MSSDAAAPAPREPRMLRYTFCIAGTQKSATTTLSALLDKHWQIRRAPRKEMHYFDVEEHDWSQPDHDAFRVPARAKVQKHLGDATPTYLWWPGALERIHDYNPEMRIIALFRDPIERLFSQWVMLNSRWPKVAPDWPELLTKYRPATLEREIPAGVNLQGYRLQSGVVRGFYGAQVQRAQELFGAERVKPLEFRDFLSDYTRVLDELTDFLEITRYKHYPELPHGMKGSSKTYGTAPTAGDVEGLVELYRDDFALFRELTGLDTSGWPLHQLVEGTTTAEAVAAKLAQKVGGPRSQLPGLPVSKGGPGGEPMGE